MLDWYLGLPGLNPDSILTQLNFHTEHGMLDFEYNHIYSMQNLQRLDLSLELSSARFAIPDKQRDHIWYTAVSLSELEISILNIEVHFRDWYRDELGTLAQSGPRNFFGLIASNLHLKRLEITSLHTPPQCRYWSPAITAVNHPHEYKPLQGLAAAELAEGQLKSWIESDPTGRLRKIVKLGRKVVDTIFPITPAGIYQGVDMPPYNQCRVWYDRFTRQYKKPGNLERFRLSENEEPEVTAELEKYKLLYLQ